MDYTKKSKTGSLKIDPVKTRQLGTGIGQAQYGMMATGAARMGRVVADMPASQKRVAPASSKATPMVPHCYQVDPRYVTPADDTQEPAETD
jgi:hypothetical protein